MNPPQINYTFRAWHVFALIAVIAILIMIFGSGEPKSDSDKPRDNSVTTTPTRAERRAKAVKDSIDNLPNL